MASFYFDIYASGRPTRYRVAAGCASPAEAKRRALNLLANFALEDVDNEAGRSKPAYAVHLTDEKGALVCAITLKVAESESP